MILPLPHYQVLGSILCSLWVPVYSLCCVRKRLNILLRESLVRKYGCPLALWLASFASAGGRSSFSEPLTFTSVAQHIRSTGTPKDKMGWSSAAPPGREGFCNSNGSRAGVPWPFPASHSTSVPGCVRNFLSHLPSPPSRLPNRHSGKLKRFGERRKEDVHGKNRQSLLRMQLQRQHPLSSG